MKWDKFVYKGEMYELSHLDPYVWLLDQEKNDKHSARQYRFNITFSLHCFTKQLPQNESVADSLLLYRSRKEVRQFCFERYELSKQLPEIINGIDKKPCWHTNHGHFFTIEIIGVPI